MGWRQTLRTIEAAQRRANKRAERDAVRRHRELQRLSKELAKQSALQQAQNEAEQYESYIKVIVSLHKDCSDVWDWKEMASAAEPVSPRVVGGREISAKNALESYQPGFFDKLFGGAKAKRVKLEREVVEAREADTREQHAAAAQHHDEVTLWQLRRRIGTGVVDRSPAAYKEALEHVAPFGELDSYGARVVIAAVEPDVVSLVCEAIDPELVPTEEVKLSATGKLTTKEMPVTRYWPLYQDYLASATLRVAREVFAVLPVSRVIVNAGRSQTNTSNGHQEFATLLGVHFLRESLSRINFDAIDPSDSMKNFQHRMKFKKGSGFEPVAPIVLDEQWVTTG